MSQKGPLENFHIFDWIDPTQDEEHEYGQNPEPEAIFAAILVKKILCCLGIFSTRCYGQRRLIFGATFYSVRIVKSIKGSLITHSPSSARVL